MTGDVTINPTASCLVMTTEVSQDKRVTMLIADFAIDAVPRSEVMREVAWVIFDEVHYMRDKGKLSATNSPWMSLTWQNEVSLGGNDHPAASSRPLRLFIRHDPNSMEFAEWICQTHEQPCHVVYTDFRPTPLQHYLFPAGSEGIYLVVDERSNFREGQLPEGDGGARPRSGRRPSGSEQREGQEGQDKEGRRHEGW